MVEIRFRLGVSRGFRGPCRGVNAPTLMFWPILDVARANRRGIEKKRIKIENKRSRVTLLSFRRVFFAKK